MSFFSLTDFKVCPICGAELILQDVIIEPDKFSLYYCPTDFDLSSSEAYPYQEFHYFNNPKFAHIVIDRSWDMDIAIIYIENYYVHKPSRIGEIVLNDTLCYRIHSEMKEIAEHISKMDFITPDCIRKIYNGLQDIKDLEIFE
jgi:hypothetical protein